jgi:outer membrane protein
MIVLAAALVLLAAAPRVLAQQPALKIGVFDPQRVSEETDEGRRVQAELTALRDKKQAEIAAKEKELLDLQTQMRAQELSLSAERRAAMDRDIQKKALEVQQAKEAAQNEIRFELGAAQQRFQDRLLVVVEQFGRDEGFTLILDRNMAAFATQSIDLTTAIVDRFNALTKASGTGPATPPPAPPAKDDGKKEGGR